MLFLESSKLTVGAAKQFWFLVFFRAAACCPVWYWQGNASFCLLKLSNHEQIRDVLALENIIIQNKTQPYWPVCYTCPVYQFLEVYIPHVLPPKTSWSYASVWREMLHLDAFLYGNSYKDTLKKQNILQGFELQRAHRKVLHSPPLSSSALSQKLNSPGNCCHFSWGSTYFHFSEMTRHTYSTIHVGLQSYTLKASISNCELIW